MRRLQVLVVQELLRQVLELALAALSA